MHVAARAKIVAGAGHDDCLDVVGIAHRTEQVAQLGVGIKGQRVLALGPVERDGRDASSDLKVKMLGLVVRQLLAIARQLVRLAGEITHGVSLLI